jgi:hypothetical protein
MKYTIDNIDPKKNHVTFTITFDDGSKHTDTRCDFELTTEDELDAQLSQYADVLAGEKKIADERLEKARKLAELTNKSRKES